MTTKFPQLPVLGHAPKKRKENLDKVLTLRQLDEILASAALMEILTGIDDGHFEYFFECLRRECKRASRRAPGVGEGQ